MKCERCENETIKCIMSFFNAQLICFECFEKEKKRPDFEIARERENEEFKKGNYDFEGIGL